MFVFVLNSLAHHLRTLLGETSCDRANRIASHRIHIVIILFVCVRAGHIVRPETEYLVVSR